MANAIVVDATALMGEFLREAPKRGPQHSRGGGSNGSKREPLPTAPPSYADLGIDKKEASDAQALSEARESKPDLFIQVRNGEQSIRAAVHIVRRVKVPIRCHFLWLGYCITPEHILK